MPIVYYRFSIPCTIMKPSGYSKTPLEKKLGIKDSFNVFLFDAPKAYNEWIQKLPLSLTFLDKKPKDIDYAHIFCTTEESLREALSMCVGKLNQTGMLWVSWPKGSSSIASTINREDVRSIVLDTGLVDIKVAAIDEDWSGLKFVIRLKDRT